jgi:5,10-methylenetetrahydrofolate reductase
MLPSPDSALFHTSSYVNWFKGRDKYGKTPLPYLDLGKDRVEQPVQTKSALEAKFKSGRFVRTCEIRAPRGSSLANVYRDAEFIKDNFDAVNVTAFLNGKPSLPSPRVAAELKKMGIDPISQATCRDHTKTSFVSELIQNHANEVDNVLCLTGDSYMTLPRIKQVWDMDSSLMLHEARYLRETGKIHFTEDKVKDAPQPFIGAVINPFTTPANVPIRRLKQKAAAGADFIQTQLIFNLEAFKEFMKRVCDEGIDNDLFILAGVPVVISNVAKNFIPHIPGIDCPQEVFERFDKASDIREEGIAFAREMIAEMQKIPGVSGVHLMLLGVDHSVLPDVVAGLD